MTISSSIEGETEIPFGTKVVMSANLINFRDEDVCTFQWQYLDQDSQKYIDIEGANEPEYVYYVSKENFFTTWRLVVSVLNNEE